jgi:hypothetical protein
MISFRSLHIVRKVGFKINLATGRVRVSGTITKHVHRKDGQQLGTLCRSVCNEA